MRYILEGLDCPNCAIKIENRLRQIEGLEAVTINFATLSMDLPVELALTAQKIISEVEPGVKLKEKDDRPDIAPSKRPERVERFWIILAGSLLIVNLLFKRQLHNTAFAWAEYAVFLPGYLIVGWTVLRQAFRNIIRGELFDESFLMSVATFGAIAVHQLPEALAVMLFYAVGEHLQERAVNRSRRSITALLKIQATFANLTIDGEIQRVQPETVAVGQLIVIKPGERAPLDGEIVEGVSYVDTSALTGETVPRKLQPGEPILAGMINGQSLLTARVTKPFQESTVSRILKLVEEAGARKAVTERFITVFAHYYTPLVVAGAVILAFVPPLVVPGTTFDEWIYRALILLVISCPCALMVSIPLGYFGGIGAASRRGILIKGSNFLEALAQVDTVVFDKTGTLTQGVFSVTEIAPSEGFNKQELLAAAAGAETHSLHPIARSIQEAYGSETATPRVSECQDLPGYGVSAIVNGKRICVGNDRMLHHENVTHRICSIQGTVVHIAIDGIYAGYLIISDQVKDDAQTTVEGLNSLGVRKIVMLTGDEASVAGAVATDLGINEYYAELLPADKVRIVEQLKAEKSGRSKGKLIFVGDGINDAPVIARADVGIAMGGLGSDAAIEAADVVLMEDNPSKLVTAIQIARNTRRIVWQNVTMALGVKAFFVVLGTMGVATIWEAVFADVGVTLLAVLNATRTLRLK